MRQFLNRKCHIFWDNKNNTTIFAFFQFVWDDLEEQNYRLWINKQMKDRKTSIDWAELESERAYRNKMKLETEVNSKSSVDWDDAQERALRQKYINER